MKILHVIPYFTPKRGGDVNVCYNLSKQFVELGHDVTIITTDFEFDHGYARSIEKVGVEIIPFKSSMNIALFLYSPGMKKWAKENLKNFDLIHLHQFRSYQNNVIHNYAIEYGIPYVLQPDNSLPRATQRQKTKRLYDWIWGNRILENASKLLAISKEEAEYARQIGIDDEKIDIVYTGMNIEYFKNLPEYGEFRRKHGINGKMILYLGRIHKLKGIGFAIKVFSKLVEEIDDIIFVIAGPDEGYRTELERLIAKMNIGHKVKFTGPVSEDEKISAYLDADLFIHTVIYMGGVGITPLEAILCDTPVIVTEQCGEVIKESNSGYIVKYGDIKVLGEKMKYVLENPQEQKEMLERGKRYIKENLTWDKVSVKIERTYNEIKLKK
ncbi:MAG: glycosyltransferase [Euryarchaeota archaeon]|nr:glycosyltransferase [Euryarchaeota archaeon]